MLKTFIKIYFSLLLITFFGQGFAQQKKMVSFYFIDNPQFTDHIGLSDSDKFWDYNQQNLFAVMDTFNHLSIYDINTYTTIHSRDVSTNNFRDIKNPTLNGFFFFPYTHAIENYYNEGVSFTYLYKGKRNRSNIYSTSSISYSSYIKHNKYQGMIRCYMSEKYNDNHYRTLFIVDQNKNLYKTFKTWEKGEGGGSDKTFKKLPGSFNFYSCKTKHPINTTAFNEDCTYLGIIENSLKLTLFDTKLEYKLIDSLSFKENNRIVDLSINGNELVTLTQSNISIYEINEGRLVLKTSITHNEKDPVFLKREINNRLFGKNEDYLLVGFRDKVHLYDNFKKIRTVDEENCIYHDGFITDDMNRFFMVKAKY